MATSSFQSEFKFNKKSASALANALDHSKKVNIKRTKPVNFYGLGDKEKLKRRFDDVFRNENED